jgi:MbtH protein
MLEKVEFLELEIGPPWAIAAGGTMTSEEPDDKTVYKVVVNHEEQYSIWDASLEIPRGWQEVGPSGTKDECLAYIKEVWTDMRPLSLRQRMDQASGSATDGP